MTKRAMSMFVGAGLLIGAWRGADAQWLRAETFEVATVGCLAVSGSDFYLGTNASSAVSYGNGSVLRSTDGGATWSSLLGKGWPGRARTPYRNGIRVGCISVSGTTILAGTSSMGVLISKDGGLSWAEGNTGLPKNAMVMALALSGAAVYAGLWDQTVFISRDGGSSWKAAGAGLPAALRMTSLVAVDSRVFVGAYYQGIFMSSDGGASWTETNAGVAGPAGLPKVSSLVAIGPDVFALIDGLGVCRFHENDRSWKPVNPGATSSATALTSSPGGLDLLVALGTNGVLVSRDKGVSWKDTAPGLKPKYKVDFLATDGSTVLAGTMTEAWRLSTAGPVAAATPAAAGDDRARDSVDVRPLMANGERAQQAKDFANAVMYYGKAIEIDPRNVDAYLQRAWSYLKLGDAGYDKALTDIAKVLSLEPANTDVYYLRGEVYRNQAALSLKARLAKDADDRLARALADYRLALEANPGSPVIPLGIGKAHLARGELDQAMAALAGLNDKNPHDTETEKTLKSLFAEYARQGRDIACGTSPATWYMAGEFYRGKKQDGQAVRCYSRAIDLGLKDHYVFRLRSLASAGLGDLEGAIADATRYIELYPATLSYADRADLYAKAGDTRKALVDIDQAIRLEKKEGPGRSMSDKADYLSRLYWRRGDFHFLSKDWNKAIGDYRLVDEKLLPGIQKQAICLQLAEAYKNKGDAANAQRYLELYKTSGPPKK